MDMPVAITDERRLKAVYDQLEANSAKRGNKVSESKEVDVGGYSGRDYLVTLAGTGEGMEMTTTIAMRIVIMGKRTLQLSVIHTMSNRSATAEKKAELLKHRMDFLNSLAPLKSAAPTVTTALLQPLR